MNGPRLVLVGPPGAGKSTVGRLLADRLEAPFVDTDARVEQEAGCSVSDIFIEHGEERFRDLELRAVLSALQEGGTVVALGGGSLTRDEVRAALRRQTVVFLDLNSDEAFRRVGLDRSRPLLAVNPRKTLRDLMDARRGLYQEVADVTVATGERSPQEVADLILAALG